MSSAKMVSALELALPIKHNVEMLCDSDYACLDNNCCPNSQVCGDNCCGDGYTCIGDSCCPNNR
ncbi:9690_t:CDS:2, partial [Cetraspora pellucida]